MMNDQAEQDHHYRCACRHELQVFGRGRYRVYFGDLRRHLHRPRGVWSMPVMSPPGKQGTSKAMDEIAIHALLTRLPRPREAGEHVLERAEILAAGPD